MKNVNYKKWIGGFIGGLVVALVFIAISADVLAAANEKKHRSYPGGADEDDLKVQAELPSPPLKLDRRSVEQKALQGYLKRSGSTAPEATSAPSTKTPNSEE